MDTKNPEFLETHIDGVLRSTRTFLLYMFSYKQRTLCLLKIFYYVDSIVVLSKHGHGYLTLIVLETCPKTNLVLLIALVHIQANTFDNVFYCVLALCSDLWRPDMISDNVQSMNL